MDVLTQQKSIFLQTPYLAIHLHRHSANELNLLTFEQRQAYFSRLWAKRAMGKLVNGRVDGRRGDK
jgi:hypothetical protein